MSMKENHMTTIYLIRHAEAEGNLYRRAHGWYNSIITDRGYRQIAALGEALCRHKIRRRLLKRPLPHDDYGACHL